MSFLKDIERKAWAWYAKMEAVEVPNPLPPPPKDDAVLAALTFWGFTFGIGLLAIKACN